MKLSAPLLDWVLKTDPGARLQYDRREGLLRHLSGRLARVGSAPAEALKASFAFLAEAPARAFGRLSVDAPGIELFRAVGSKASGYSMLVRQFAVTRVRGKERLVRVVGGSIRFAVDAEGTLTDVENRWFAEFPFAVDPPRFSRQGARKIALRFLHRGATTRTREELEIRTPPGGLVWKVTVPDPPAKDGRPALSATIVIVDAMRGIVAAPAIGTGRLAGTGFGHWYRAGYQVPLPTRARRNGGEEMVDASRTARQGPVVRVLNWRRQGKPDFMTDGHWPPAPGRAKDADNPGIAVDAFLFAGEVVDAFLDLRDTIGFSVAGTSPPRFLPDPLDLIVHKSISQPGRYEQQTEQVMIADSARPKRWLICSTKDVIAHEITHSLTHAFWDLPYSHEEGALDEAIADGFAALITGDPELFEDAWIEDRNGDGHADTVFGNVKFKDYHRRIDFSPGPPGVQGQVTPARAIKAVGQPQHYSGRWKLTAGTPNAGNDFGFVHINCGILSSAIWLLWNGGTHPQSGIAVAPIGRDRTQELLLRALTSGSLFEFNAASSSTRAFSQFRIAMTAVASAPPYDADPTIAVAVIDAFDAIGVGSILTVKGRPRPPVAATLAELLTQGGENADDLANIVVAAGGAAGRGGGGAGNRLALSVGGQFSVRVGNLSVSDDASTPTLRAFLGRAGAAAQELLSPAPVAVEPLEPREVALLGPFNVPAGLAPANDYTLIVVAEDPWHAVPDPVAAARLAKLPLNLLSMPVRVT